jgi:hypothetical protein
LEGGERRRRLKRERREGEGCLRGRREVGEGEVMGNERGGEGVGRARGGEGKGGVLRKRGTLWEGRGATQLENLSPWMGCTQKMACLPIQFIQVACERVRVRVWPVLRVGGQRLKKCSPHPVPCRPRVSA